MYLLSTQTFLDLLCGVDAVKDFADRVPRGSVYLSVVSLGLVEEVIRETDIRDGRDELDRYYRRLLSVARANSTVEVYGESAASWWAKLSGYDFEMDDEGMAREMSDLERMVVATALDRRLVLVEQAQPYHGQIQELQVLDPYAA
jgi:hypothetical protein